MPLTVDHAHSIAIWLEALLYGVYLCLFLSCAFILYTRRVNGKTPAIMLSTMVLMFLLNTCHVVGTFWNVDVAFFGNTGMTPAAYLSDRSTALNLLDKSLYGAVLLIGDGLLIYRCWVIWQRNWWIVVAPITFLLATTGTGCSLVFFYSKLSPGASIYDGQVAVLTPLTFIFSFISNLLTTGLIVYRIRRVSAAVRHALPGQANEVLKTYKYSLAVIIESGAIYPLFLIISCVLYVAGQNAQAVFTGSMCQVIGIVPTLAVLQVRLGLSSYDAACPHTSTPRSVNTGYPATPSPQRDVFRLSHVPRPELLSARSTVCFDDDASDETMVKAYHEDGESRSSMSYLQRSKSALSTYSKRSVNLKRSNTALDRPLERPLSIHLERTVIQTFTIVNNLSPFYIYSLVVLRGQFCCVPVTFLVTAVLFFVSMGTPGFPEDAEPLNDDDFSPAVLVQVLSGLPTKDLVV